MKPQKNGKNSRTLLCRPGVTLLELTVVITVLLMLLGFLFPVSSAWKRGAARSHCIMNIRQVQMGVRSFSNLAGLEFGTDISPQVLQNEIVGSDKFVEDAPVCPSNGTYTYAGNVIPQTGTLYLTCSLAASDSHVPDDFANW